VDTVTFLFTDIAGSTALLRRVGEQVYGQVLADHHTVIRSALAAHDGTEVDTQGDGFFATFASPRACLAAVLAMQRGLATHAWPDGERVQVRMGVHTGEATQTVTGLVGFDVHRAARVAAVAHGGQVLVSETTASLVDGRLPVGVALVDLGLHRLKDMARPERLYQLSGAGLAADFPPLRSLDNPALRHNLPLQLTPFIGRSKELAAVTALVAARRIVTLTGAGGCGKTRLGLQVAAGLLDGSGDGVWLIELATVADGEAVAPAIAAVLGVPEQPGRPTVEVLADALEPQEMLIVLDNCEHLISSVAKVTDVIGHRCPRVHVLATSREPLGIGGEVVYRVPSLSLPDGDDNEADSSGPSDAVALFVDRAKTHGVDLSTTGGSGELVVSVCRRLDGMPLAIELAAARLRSMSLATLHDRLDQRFRLLTGGSRTALERQQTLRAAVSWSYALLTNPEQLLFQRLAAFAGGFDLDAAEAVCGFGDIAAFDVAELLGSLVDKSLVIAERADDAVSYRLLETIRQFAAERLIEAGEQKADAVAAAHSAHFLALAEAAGPQVTGPQQRHWMALLDAARPDLQRGLRFAADCPDGTAQVLRFAVALRRFWSRRWDDDGMLALLLPVLDRPDAEADKRLFVAAVIAACRQVVLGPARGLRLAELAVGLANELGDERLHVEALYALTVKHFHARDIERARVLATETLQRARRIDDDVLVGEGLFVQLIFAEVMDSDDAAQLFAEAVSHARRSGDHFMLYAISLSASNHALRSGDLESTRDHVERAMRAAKELGGDRSFMATAQLGSVLRLEGNWLAAQAKFAEALRMSRQSGDHAGLAYSYLGQACIAADLQDWRRSAELHGVAQGFVDRTERPWQDLEAGYRRESIDRVLAALGQAEFDEAFAEGMALSFDAAFALATQTAAPDALSGPGTAAPEPADLVAVPR
jgi:predicted ATPase/class 3 adenylate cyclase